MRTVSLSETTKTQFSSVVPSGGPQAIVWPFFCSTDCLDYHLDSDSEDHDEDEDSTPYIAIPRSSDAVRLSLKIQPVL